MAMGMAAIVAMAATDYRSRLARASARVTGVYSVQCSVFSVQC